MFAEPDKLLHVNVARPEQAALVGHEKRDSAPVVALLPNTRITRGMERPGTEKRRATMQLTPVAAPRSEMGRRVEQLVGRSSGDGWCPPELPDPHTCASFALSALCGQCNAMPATRTRTRTLRSRWPCLAGSTGLHSHAPVRRTGVAIGPGR
jgi:hypothetical protein